MVWKRQLPLKMAMFGIYVSFQGGTSFQHHMTEKHLGSPSCMVNSQNRCLEKWTMKMYEPYFQCGFSNQEYIILRYLSFKKKTPPYKIWIFPKIGVFPPKSSHFKRDVPLFSPIHFGVQHPYVQRCLPAKNAILSLGTAGKSPVLEVETISNTEVNVLHGRPKNENEDTKSIGIFTSDLHFHVV